MNPVGQVKDKQNGNDQSVTPLIVAIGASAGGLEAFRAFFSTMPPDTGMAFVLVQHLSPEHQSILVELLTKYTPMPVTEAKDGMKIVSNQVFVITPNTTLNISHGHLVVKSPAPKKNRQPIDMFFFSLAQDQGPNAIGIILSGTGSDGSLGLVAIKEEGGITFTQAETDHHAKEGMPSSAVATGEVDYVLPVEAMPAKIIEYQDHLNKINHSKTPAHMNESLLDLLPEILKLIHSGIGYDFSHYKMKTLVRRIQRRIHILQIGIVEEYIKILRKDPQELKLLFLDLLISVTEFFRDTDAFNSLEINVIPMLLKDKGIHDQIRVWVPACATGDEAYSIAIILAEALEKLPVSPKVLILATDIDARAITVARSGRYLKSHLDGVSPERLDRWFVQDGNHFMVNPQIREMCNFSVHSVIKDPPFSKLDLITCRNFLIYVDAVIQERLMPIFHYALIPGGSLFLGLSESVGQQCRFFSVLDEKNKLFARINDTAAILPHFPLTDLELMSKKTRVTLPKISSEEKIYERGARRVRDRYLPATVVIDRQNQVLNFSGQTGKYLNPTSGSANFDLFNLIQEALRPPTRELLNQAIDSDQRVQRENIRFKVNGIMDTVTIIIEPILPPVGKTNYYLIIFQQGYINLSSKNEMNQADHRETIDQLEKALLITQERLQASLDQSEDNNKSKSPDAELQSINEELQSSNEELETAKEEMQSINEELQTVNVELKDKNDASTRVNNDLQNFFDSTQIATMFLDENLCVRNFTPAITTLFTLRKSDLGRPITEICNRLSYKDLENDVKLTLSRLTVVKREVSLSDPDTTFVMHIRPYRTEVNVVDGVVITFVDITDRKLHEAALSRLVAILESSNDAIIGHSLEGIITSWNSGAEQILGYTAAEAIGQPFIMLFSENRIAEMSQLLEKIQSGESIKTFHIGCMGKNAKPMDVSLTITLVYNIEGAIIGISTIARDMTEWVRSEHHRDLLLGELNHRVKNTLATIQSIARQTAKEAPSVEDFNETFQDRLLALSRTHNLLVESQWQGALLGQIVGNELIPYDSSQFTVNGEDVQLNSQQVIALGMAIHELATNAAKYGALSVSTGRVLIAWVLDGGILNRMLRIRWIESNGPRVTKPTRRGFGSQLIERSLASEEAGEVRLEYNPDGVNCFLQFLMTLELEPKPEIVL